MSGPSLSTRLRAHARTGIAPLYRRTAIEAADHIDALRKALEPFGAYAENSVDVFMVDVPDDAIVLTLSAKRVTSITIGHLRTARSLLFEGGGE